MFVFLLLLFLRSRGCTGPFLVSCSLCCFALKGLHVSVGCTVRWHARKPQGTSPRRRCPWQPLPLSVSFGSSLARARPPFGACMIVCVRACGCCCCCCCCCLPPSLDRLLTTNHCLKRWCCHTVLEHWFGSSCQRMACFKPLNHGSYAMPPTERQPTSVRLVAAMRQLTEASAKLHEVGDPCDCVDNSRLRSLMPSPREGV